MKHHSALNCYTIVRVLDQVAFLAQSQMVSTKGCIKRHYQTFSAQCRSNCALPVAINLEGFHSRILQHNHKLKRSPLKPASRTTLRHSAPNQNTTAASHASLLQLPLTLKHSIPKPASSLLFIIWHASNTTVTLSHLRVIGTHTSPSTLCAKGCVTWHAQGSTQLTLQCSLPGTLKYKYMKK